MRITRLKLVNFIGIKDGMNKDEIEIFFPDNGNKFTILNGGNGCGKSTILSTLHPFKETFDDRKELIYGEEGSKEIDIISDESVYKIRHYYGKHAGSFIEKDGVELNPGGGIRLFEDKVRDELGITKEYFNIGKIGSNTDNFVHFSTTKRKEYISTFVSEVEKYLKVYDTVSKKYKLDSDKLKSLAKDLTKYDKSEMIASHLETIKEELKTLENEIIAKSKEEAIIGANIEHYNTKMSEINYIELKNAMGELENSAKQIQSTIKMIESKNINNENFNTDLNNIQKLKDILVKNKISIATLEKDIHDLSNKSIEYQNAKINNQYKLNGLSTGTDDNSDSLNKELTKLENNKKKITKELEKLNIIKYFEGVNVNSLPLLLNKYIAFMQFLIQNYNQLKSNTIDPKLTNIELFFKRDCTRILTAQRELSRNTITETAKLKDEKVKECSFKNANLGKLDILEKRPHECNIDSCPFIADALKYKNLPSEIENLEVEIENIKVSLEDLNYKAEQINEVINLFRNTSAYYKNLSASENIIYKYQVDTYGNIVEIMSKPLNEVEEIFNLIKHEVDIYIDSFNKLLNINDLIKQNTNTLEKINNSKEVIDLYTNEIKKIDKQLEKNTIEYADKKEQLDKLNQENFSLDVYITDLTNYNSALNEMEKITNAQKANKKLIDKYEDISAKKIEATSNRNNLTQLLSIKQSEKTKITDDITNSEVALRHIADLEKQEKELNETYVVYDIIKDALDPRSGIPLVYVKAYLGKTEIIANELLNIAFNGKFEIHFESGPKDFFIQVRTGDSIKSDIKNASQGEIALTTISISLALIEQSIQGFNVLSLDEIDGALDDGNREAFINILDSQIRKLDIEQVFIISHNDAFDSVPMNIIALPGAKKKLNNPEYMKNKTVIYNFEETGE